MELRARDEFFAKHWFEDWFADQYEPAARARYLHARSELTTKNAIDFLQALLDRRFRFPVVDESPAVQRLDASDPNSPCFAADPASVNAELPGKKPLEGRTLYLAGLPSSLPEQVMLARLGKLPLEGLERVVATHPRDNLGRATDRAMWLVFKTADNASSALDALSGTRLWFVNPEPEVPIPAKEVPERGDVEKWEEQTPPGLCAVTLRPGRHRPRKPARLPAELGHADRVAHDLAQSRLLAEQLDLFYRVPEDTGVRAALVAAEEIVRVLGTARGPVLSSSRSARALLRAAAVDQ